MIRSSIDLGTNTCLMLVVDWDPQAYKIARVIADRSTVVRLGQGVDREKRFNPAAMERTLNCLEGYAAELRKLGGEPSETVAVATAQARDSQNWAEFSSNVFSKTGFRFQILSGEEEARGTFLGALLPNTPAERVRVIDIGGGSTEFSTLSGGVSTPLGSVRFTERYFLSDPVTDEEFQNCIQAIDSELQRAGAAPGGPEVFLGVAGTVTTLAAWKNQMAEFDRERLDGFCLSVQDVELMALELKRMRIEDRKKQVGIEEKRADVLLAGALILWRSILAFGYSEVRVSTRGLRYGVLAHAPNESGGGI